VSLRAVSGIPQRGWTFKDLVTHKGAAVRMDLVSVISQGAVRSAGLLELDLRVSGDRDQEDNRAEGLHARRWKSARVPRASKK
jgi:hypothetical protein